MKMLLGLIAGLLLLTVGCIAQSASARPAVPDINGRATLLVRPEFSDAVGALAADSSTLLVNVVVGADGIRPRLCT